MKKINIAELAKKMMEQPEVAPAPRIKPSEPTTKPGKGKPKWRPRTAPKPAPKAEQKIIDDIVARLTKLNEQTSKYSLSEMLNEINIDNTKPKASAEEMSKNLAMLVRKNMEESKKASTSLINILNEINIDDIKKKFVGDRTGGPGGKVVTPKEFDDIMEATNNKLALALWMIKRIQDGFLLPEDIYKWEEYFDIFKRLKREFPKKDINQIKTEDDLDDFINKAEEIKDRELDPSQKKGVSKSDKFADLRIGEVDGYQVYKIPQGTSDEMYGAACELGSGTSWCTATGNTKQWFDRYAKDGPLYIFIGPDGDKYQFHYESSQYMDKNDRSILGRNF
mgnify:CR=1 FL=1